VSDSLVIIPTYKEKENIVRIIRAVISLVYPIDILVVDDNSPDGTADLVRELMEEIPGRIYLEERKGKLGLGTAYIHGFKWGLEKGYEYIMEMDADFSHNPIDLIRLRDACVQGADVAIGSRYVSGVNVVNWPMSRVMMSYFASVYVRYITGMHVMDTTAGFKAYKRKVLETINFEKIKFIGYAFQIEMKFTAWKHGFIVKEIPIIFTDRSRGESKMSKGIFKEAVIGVLEMKIGSWFRKYEQKTI